MIYAEESLEPMVQGLLGIIMPRRSVRRKKGSLNLFFFPPHPIFRSPPYTTSLSPRSPRHYHASSIGSEEKRFPEPFFLPSSTRNLIIVIFYYQISLNPLKTLSLSKVSLPLDFPLCYIFPYGFMDSDKGKYKGKKIL